MVARFEYWELTPPCLMKSRAAAYVELSGSRPWDHQKMSYTAIARCVVEQPDSRLLLGPTLSCAKSNSKKATQVDIAHRPMLSEDFAGIVARPFFITR